MPESNLSSYNSGAASMGSAGMEAGGAMLQIGLQNLWNKKNVDAMNRYNSPASQMQRYQAAGLNPNLIYGQGTPGNQTVLPEITAPSFSFMPFAMKAIAFENLKRQGKILENQSKEQEARILNLYSKTRNQDLQGVLSRLKAQELDARSPYFSQMAKYQADAATQKLKMMLKDLDLKSATHLNLQMDNLIKRDVHTEKAYYNMLMQETGMGKQDNFLYRGGYNLGKKAYDLLNEWWKK